MKTFRHGIFWACVLVLPVTLFSQTASDLCHEELKTAWSMLDADQLRDREDVCQLSFTYSYYMREQKKESSERVVAMAGENQTRWMSTEGWVITDGSTTFTWFPYRYVLYRTDYRDEDRTIIRGMDADLFDHGLVRECYFFPVNSTVTHKRITFVADAEGSSKYGVKDVELIIIPGEAKPLMLRINFTDDQPHAWARYDFTAVEMNYNPADWTSPEEFMLNEEGQPDARFGGTRFYDYRKSVIGDRNE